jgi:hypothetical protein
MPITKAERSKLRSHTFSEYKNDEFKGTHLVTPNISAADTLKHSLRQLVSKPSVLILNLPGSLIFAIYSFFMFRSDSLANSAWYTVVFFALGIFVVAPLTAIAKSKFANARAANLFSTVLISLNYLEPLVPAAYISIMVLAIQKSALITIFSTIIAAMLFILIAAIILQIINLNSAMSIYLMFDKKLKRGTAINRSWMFLSGQSSQMLMINIAAYTPLIIAVILEAAFSNTLLMPYLALLTFLLADVCTSWWQACTSYIYAKIIKEFKPIKYSRL